MTDNMKKAAVLGWPITQSKSPLIHGYWLKSFGISGSYEALAVKPEDFSETVSGLAASGYRGCNVTIPHKEAALALADVVSDRATQIGAVNTLVFKDGKIYGDNTDGYGFINNLAQRAPDWRADVGTAMVLGAGGAARAIVHGLLAEGAPKVLIANRTLATAQKLAAFFGDKTQAIELGQIESHMQDVTTLVNTTSLGMVGQNALDIDLTSLPKTATVTDIVYNPLRTELLEQAQKLGLSNVDGLGMLLHQAVPGFDAWFGATPKVDDTLRRIILDAL